MRQFFHPETNAYFSEGSGFTLAHTQYPDNWLEHATANDLSSLGLVEVIAVSQRADDRYYDNAEQLDQGVITITATPKDIGLIRIQKQRELSAHRFAIETGGITLPDGTRIATDRDSQAMISGALLTVQHKPEIQIDWKGEAGWSKLGKASIEAIADAVSAHVQACFSAEAEQSQALSALSDFDSIIAFPPEIAI